MHVWRVELTAVTDEIVELLCPQERARAERLYDLRTRRLWMSSRGVLRALLGRYTQREPSALRFAGGARGKPQLRPPGPSFSLSHSGQLALYAFAAASAVGVDVETTRRPLHEVALARRAFGPAEARRLAELGPAERRREFLRAWVRHEAELKCLGAGTGGAGDAGGRTPWITELEVGRGAAGAVAALQAPHEVRCWDWGT